MEGSEKGRGFLHCAYEHPKGESFQSDTVVTARENVRVTLQGEEDSEGRKPEKGEGPGRKCPAPPQQGREQGGALHKR